MKYKSHKYNNYFFLSSCLKLDNLDFTIFYT